MSLVHAHDIRKRYVDGPVPVEVLRSVSLTVEEGDIVGICGASGSGKSTLLHLLGGLDRATAGEVFFDGLPLSHRTDEELAHLRNRSIGFVFQFYHLLTECTALENVMLPCLIAGVNRGEATTRATEVLVEMGLSDRAGHHPALLSGGEQQRVAIARAIVMRPRLLLADEPTRNLDRATGESVWTLLTDLSERHRMTMVVVSHNRDLLRTLPRVLELKDGRLDAEAA
ncbi:MAG: ABC transporter ATP-binding protein [Deltaproteobacteria bacterium]|nr:ABC transporter ATP-binding protein [Deltaproteobacteria bacterium]